MKNIPKIIHLYWDGSPMSYLQHLTVHTLHEYNPEWSIIIHVPTQRHEQITWHTGEQSVKYVGTDYWPMTKKLDYVEINTFNFQETTNVSNDIPEVFKSDIYRWYLLSTLGGVWTDFDILYTKPLSHIKSVDAETTTAIVFDGFHHIIGFYMAEPNNQFFKSIYDKSKSSINFYQYQSVGSRLLMAMYPNMGVIHNNFKGVVNLGMDVVYPVIASDKTIYDLFTNFNNDIYFTDNTIGVHWYNGDSHSKYYTNNFDTMKNNDSTMSKMIEKYDIHSNSVF